jgi:hypothetical protein
LDFPPGYIDSLAGASDHDNDPVISAYPGSSSKEQTEKEKTNGKATEKSRQTGDWSTYKYYMQAMGWWRMLMFVLLVAVDETFTGLQSKPHLVLYGPPIVMMLTRARRLAELVGNEQ